MNAVSLLKFMGEQGARFNRDKLPLLLDYFNRMIDDRRIVVIEKDGATQGFAAFSLGDDVLQYLEKSTWNYKPHNPDGRTICIEKLVSKEWNREVRNIFESEILKLYPQIQSAVWHRWAKWGDRKVTRRVGNYV